MEKRKVKKIRVFGHPWHIAHQYSLNSIPFMDWSWLVQYKRPYSTKPRGDFMKNWVAEYEEGKYDVAVLHLDQQCIEEGILEYGKGFLYRILNERIKDIPKIVIMHGTPYYPEKFGTDEDKTGRTEVIKKVKELIGDNVMITNSKQCAEDFGFGRPIVHGLKADDWWDLPKEPRTITMISPAGLDMYYDRAFLQAVKEELEERGISHCHITVDKITRDWDEYRDFIGRSLIYFNPAKDSPMPRSRTEAMLSGCCVITTPHQDADTFIEDGVNGIICPRNPQWVADKIEWLMNNYDEAVKIGQAGKETAKKLFNEKVYEAQWKQLLEDVLNVEIENE